VDGRRDEILIECFGRVIHRISMARGERGVRTERRGERIDLLVELRTELNVKGNK
jgi:hypothetical protein